MSGSDGWTFLWFPQPWSATQTALAAKDVPLGLAGVGFAISLAAAVSISVSQNVFTNLLRGFAGRCYPRVDAGDVIQQGATGFLQHIAENEMALVLVIYNSAVTSCFWLSVAAACVGFVAALGMDWNSVKGKQKEGNEEEKKETGSEREPVA